MARSKNRRKKPKKDKKPGVSSNKRRSIASSSEDSSSEPTEELIDYASDADYSGGTMSGMRNLVSGGGQARENVFSRRRSLGEWTLIFGVIGTIYFIVNHWFL
ncbi:MAG: hypothetical protein VYC39_15995 [Myxococcota bacterium]|nr:hypothetical protein [Myxococcota bacterium]